jgi:ABC-2 type transport system permease protein
MFSALTKLFIRLLATRARLLILSVLALGMVLLSVFALGHDPIGRSWRLFSLYALGGLVPVASLVMGSSVFGDLVEDRTLVHLWLRPAPRRTLLLSAWVATLVLVVPFSVVVPAIALLAGGMSLHTALVAAASAALGTLAYTAAFVALGLRVRRALAWGLAYILIWEGAVANAGAGLARLALRLSTRSIAHRAFDGTTIRYPIATASAVVVLCVVTLVSLALGVRWLQRADVA